MNAFIIFFVAVGSVLALANAIPVSPGGLKDNDPKITAALTELKKLVESNQQPADSSIRDNLLSFVRSLFLSAGFTGTLKLPVNLVGAISSALEDDSNDGLIGLLEAVISGLIVAIEKTTAEFVISGLTNSDLDSEQNALVRKYICEALGLSEQDAQNGDVLAFVNILLKGLFAFIVQYFSATTISGIDGLVTGLLKGGVMCGVSEAVKSLNVDSKKHFVDVANTVLN